MSDFRPVWVQTSLRMRKGLQDQLREAAVASGGRISDEIIRRLEQSFRDDRIIGEFADLRTILEAIKTKLPVGTE